MQYIVVHFNFDNEPDYVSDLLAASLGEIGFESFTETEEGFDAYIPAKKMNKDEIAQAIESFPYARNIRFTDEKLEDKDWNEEWEKHFFEPIIIENECVIHSSFHKDVPKLKYDIIINPKMSFCSGHHETTGLMIAEILHQNLVDKTVLDMGCGTSVLAILASLKGAAAVTAIDIDDWCVENSKENIQLNNIKNIQVQLGDASLLKSKHFDVILANINRNILLTDMHIYADCLPVGGILFMSGFYSEDVPLIQEQANQCGLEMNYSKQKNNWALVKVTKRKELRNSR
jgi:ribosomal protein L11 methyltransferase